MLKHFLIGAVLLSAAGCTSFRTTALYRFSNDSVAPEQTNRKLKGLPVKLKVPSHVHVTVYEQQVILANSSDEVKAKAEAAASAAANVTAQDSLIKGLSSAIVAADQTITNLEEAQEKLRGLIANAPGDEETALKKVFGDNVKALAKAKIARLNALRDLATEPDEQEKLRKLRAKEIVAERDATIKYSLLSFNPPQCVVDTRLLYTDKIFLVDFKRPAGGVLDLKEAQMDDEQYFSKVQAEVQERTLQDISTALNTVKDPLANLIKKDKGNVAIPTSAGTPAGDSNDTVNFQKSVVATQRFDISESGWEQRLQDFVNEHIGDGASQTVSASPDVYSQSTEIYHPVNASEHQVAPVESATVFDSPSDYYKGSNAILRRND